MAETGMTFDENDDDEEAHEDPKAKTKKGKKVKVEEVDEEELARRKAAAAKVKDIATYGVSIVNFLIFYFVAHLDLGRFSRRKGRN